MKRFIETGEPEDAAHRRIGSYELREAMGSAPDEAEAPAGERIDAHRLWLCANRAQGEPVDLAVHRALRADASVRLKYQRLLGARALGLSTVARAAASGDLARRRIAGHELWLSAGEGEDPPVLVVSRLEADAAPATRIEAMGAADGEESHAAIDLPEATRGHAMVTLDRANAAHAALERLLQNPDASIWLI